MLTREKYGNQSYGHEHVTPQFVGIPVNIGGFNKLQDSPGSHIGFVIFKHPGYTTAAHRLYGTAAQRYYSVQNYRDDGNYDEG